MGEKNRRILLVSNCSGEKRFGYYIAGRVIMSKKSIVRFVVVVWEVAKA